MNKTWTLLFVPHSEKTVRKISIKPGLIALFLLLCLAVIFAGVYLASSSLDNTYNFYRLAELDEDNAILLQKVRTMDREIVQLSGHIEKLLDENQQYRCVAGLQLLNEDVIEAGIGGMLPVSDPDLFEIDSDLALKLQNQNIVLDALLRKVNLASQSVEDAIESIKATSDKWFHYPSIKPTRGYISSSFGRRLHPVFQKMNFHSGIDLRTSKGTPILATADGRVIKTSKMGGFGRTITIDHSYGIHTFYAHCSKINVEEGQVVKRGEVIAYVGQTGTTTGDHLHYEVHVYSVPKNPLNFILDSYVP